MYKQINKASRLARVSVLVDQLAAGFEADRLPKSEAEAARAQISELVSLLSARKGADARQLASALRRLSNRLAQVDGRRRARQADKIRNRRLMRALRRIALIVAAGAVMSAPLAAAAAAPDTSGPPAVEAVIPVLNVGDPVFNPVTELDEEVVEVISPAVVRTDQGNFILLAQTVGDTFTDPETGESYEVTVVTLNVEGNPVTVTVEDSAGDPFVLGVVTDKSGEIAGVVPDPDGPDGSGSGGFTFTPAAGDINTYANAQRGNDGSDGSDGGGVRICVPLLGCATIGKHPSSGGDGATGPTVNVTIDSTWGDIESVSDGLPGIVASSVGGNGGQGGDGYGIDIPGASGGRAGQGGSVTLAASVTVTTSGEESHGIFAQSRSGRGGDGGTGYIASGGGGGGTPGQGGTVHVTHSGAISTTGDGAMGILAQSLGGAAGGGGDSYGIIGDGGGGTVGGNGGSVTVDHSGLIVTSGDTAHGILAQSIGGSGGNAGHSGGIVTFGDSGDAGGNGGSASIIARGGSSTLTTGEGSHGLFAQSVGGGGGNGGNAGGLVTLGSGGGAGGAGGSASINLETGGVVGTTGDYSYGLFAQSVGGGGGDSGASGGAVTLGASGDAGGAGGAVNLTTGGVVSTEGLDSRGVFAQSVGGGGGAARGSGGIVSLGGGGAGGGAGGAVTVTATETSSILTSGAGGDGIFAQSVGGGGGSGSSSGGVVSLGGTGGGGGAGGVVSITHGGEIETAGLNARGIFAQSVGGGGGSGGHSGGLVSIGGGGGAASHGGDVGVTNTGGVTTAGNLASAIQAQSIGGGGGDGGTTGGVFLTIGGGGGGGGNSGVVTVNHSGALFTGGDDSHGIFAQAVGGGGGNGGASVSVSAFAGVAVGGSGGNGGEGGTVNVNLSQSLINVGGAPTLVDPLIVTSGDRSRGVFIQSVGGGGGNGGMSAQVAAGYGGAVSVSVGGGGGDGGDGGVVNLTGDATIQTQGDYAEGLFAQAVGGGGGNGGYALSFAFAGGETAAGALSVGVGGAGGGGGQGGAVNVDSGGQIVTEGDFSTGLLAQSVGGGGGNGGFSVSFAGSAAGVASASAAVGVGGSGGDGGDGGVVDVDFDGLIVTAGDDSGAALIQSVGGGGGNGGFNVSGAVSFSGGGSGAGAVGVGGYGGDGGVGAAATGHVHGPVQTSGDRSTGVVVQSLGGGGGNGGFNISGSIGGAGTFGGALSIGVGGAGGGGGDAGAATGSAGSTIYTTGDQSGGLLVQSVGGGGGNGAFNVAAGIGGGGTVGGALSVGVGGAGGGGGDGGAVRGDAFGAVVTTGDQSDGVTVQSIGGGGGGGAFNISGGIGGGGTVGAALSVGVGGAGGGGGDGGEVDASAGPIATFGDQSGAFLAQSVGGGGGSGGFSVAGSIGGANTVGAGISVGVGGSGGGGGDGARVGATVTGDVTTHGDDADGVVAQSIGGGGGSGGFAVAGSISGAATAAGSVSVGVGGSGGDGGESGDVTLDVTGATRTWGDDSDGVFAQSVGGGGGNGAFSVVGNIAVSGVGAGTLGVAVGGTGGGGGNSGAVDLQINAGVADPDGDLLAALTLGDGARAVVAQSVGGGGGNGGFTVAAGIAAAKDGAGNIGVGVGGGGGDGGDAGAVSGEVTGDVMTAGADASAVLVQSVGGGGGNGGFNITGGIAGSKTAAGNLLVGVGGFGGGGGDAGAVSGFVAGDIITEGDRSFGASYQSLGGGGGNGGFNITGGISLTIASGGGAGNIGVGVGGFGGDGGDAASVDAQLVGDISTLGLQAHGALLQSVGGGGGSGGFNITGGISASSGVSGTLGFGLGGFGGGGGNAGDVTGVLTGNVTTFGDESFGAVLQSVGGAGGNGGLNVTGAVSFTTSNNASVAIGLGIGGFGGGGGDAGAVTGTVTGDYITAGREADGVVAQSLGGGGGNGGLNISGAVALGAGTAGTGAVGIGGFGGAGGDSADVILTRVGNTQTDGANSDGVLAQSLAGGGGNGAINISGGVSGTTNGSAASLGFGLGGFGGGGGDAGSVTASITGNVLAQGLESDIVTPEQTITVDVAGLPAIEYVIPATRERLNGSHGVVAQSVGGGGGTGGLNVTGQISITQPGSSSVTSRAAAIGIGGFGGDGGDAGAVELTIDAPGSDRVQVQAIGDDRVAVMAQSLGGGGGVGAINVSGGVAMDGTLTVGVGGFGGDGGLGRDVTADVDADLFASGHRSRGLAAQSIGGGGGSGGINISGGISGNTAGSEPAIAFGLGGFGGAGNRSGDVDVSHSGQIMVDGIDSVGLLAQSVAGGGGSGGLNVTGTLNLTGGSSGGAFSRGFAASVGVGGSGGDGADAGDVSVDSAGNIIINGQMRASPAPGDDPFEAVGFTGGSTGLLAQSVGGGGGTGGMNINGAFAPNGNPVSIAVGGSGGSGGHAGSVAVVRGFDGGGAAAPGLIRTFGDTSTGLLAQSIGGGGGNAGMNFNLAAAVGSEQNNPIAALITVGGSGAGAGSGDTVSVTHNGNIVTDGRYSTGLHAQSVGGGGGNANFNIGLGFLKDATSVNLAVGGDTGAGGSGGAVGVDHEGVIITQGVGSAGIKAQSIGGGGGNTGTDLNMSLKAENSLDIVIGRLGGVGGEGGDVTVTAAGLIDTTGNDSSGIFAQSIGGGGGASSATSVGGSVTSGSGDNAEAYALNVAIGLEGGTGATGGDVAVTSSADIVTRGDDSRAIFAQSVGGGGGAGGTTTNIVLQATGAVTLGVGGTGGTGALSGTVDVINSATLVTQGERADGILAQSVGGGGGMGGMAITAGLQIGGVPDSSTARTIAVNVGGTGGTGADGNTVTVANSGVIATAGDAAYGVRAQSVGGGGGLGGGVLNLRAQGRGNNQAIDINVGGSGNTGGSGGLVTVTNDGSIFTEGDEAAGIAATSIGGGGGDAGTVINAVGGVSGTTNNSQQLTVNIGGSGGTGGTGGEVSVSNLLARDGSGDVIAGSGQIVTQGQNAYGIFAQSLGGGGGNGSTVLSVTAMQSSENSAIVGFNLGGFGGAGNTGGDVAVVNEGLIDTSGDGAHGVVAQSVGGGGGNGGMVIALNAALGARASSPLLAVGGVGGDGGDGGDVVVDNSGLIVTRGANAHGVVAQSIGGGGGNASMAFGLTGEPISLLLSNSIAAIVGATGGGTGGAGGEVTVNHSGDITVLGDGSFAIKAESINGGGGSIDLNFTGLVGFDNFPLVGPGSDPAVTDPTVQLRAGSSDTSDMNAGRVSVNTTGTFGAGGDNGAASFTQSIGGGGGTIRLIASLSDGAAGAPIAEAAPHVGPTVPQAAAIVPIDFDLGLGGINGVNNSGGDVVSAHVGAIVTSGVNTHGVLLQSVGDGGGYGVLDVDAPTGTAVGTVDLALGSLNGLNGAGGDIIRAQSGSVATSGDFAAGAILQSVGGGGGAIAARLQGPGSAGAIVRTTLGADGGADHSGGDVTAAFSGGVATFGDLAHGLILQSIGTGGGQARLNGGGALDVTLGGANGAQGDGGDITLANDGSVYTQGARAHGVFLQSIGGGGGAVFGDFTAPTLTLNADNSGDGGAIIFAQSGDIVVLGEGAFGLVAQSVGGGGGWVDGVFAGTAGGAGQGGTIDLALSGQVFAVGDGGVGILAQSLGANGGGDITLVSDGLVRGGGGDGAGVVFDGGDQNLIQTTGSISAVSGLAIQTGDGDEWVGNEGLVVGNIDLGAGDNVFLNGAAGTFIAFDTIDLRDQSVAQGDFVNDGQFLMGLSAPTMPIDLAAGDVFGDLDSAGDPASNLLYGARVINTVELDGEFIQTANGHLEFDVAFGPYASDRVNVTGDAVVDGTGDITLTWLENTDEVTLFATAGAGVDNGLEISDTIALDYSIRADAAGVHLGFVSDFGQDFLNENGQSLGRSIDSAILAGGSGGIGRLAALLGNQRAGDEDIYSAIFTELDPSPHLEPLHLQFATANSFSNELFGCANVVMQSGEQCVWSRIEHTSRDSVADFEAFGTASHGVRLRAGFEQQARGLWSVAAAVGYDDIDHMQVDNFRAVSEGKSLNLGLGMRRTAPGGLEADVAVSGGWQWMETRRNMDIFGPATGASSPESRYGQLSGHVAHLVRQGAFFARPALNASVTALHADGFSESGLGGNGVERLEDTQYLATLNPELQFGVVFAETPGAQGVLSFTVGGVFQSEDRIESPFRLLGANPLSDPAVISTPLDREGLRVGADFSIAADNGVSLRLRYTGEFGDRTDSHSAGLDLRYRF